MDHPDDEDDEDGLYDYLLDSGVLNDVHTVAESIVSSSMSSADLMRIGTDSDSDSDSAAQTIADRLMERNADDLDRALDAIVRDAKLAAAEGCTHRLDFRWPVLPDGSVRRTSHETLRDLNALVRLPFTYDTYAGPYFRKLTKGLERTATVDAFFERTARVYAKLVDTAPDAETAAESFASLCEATHLRCQRRRHDFAKSVAAVCLVVRCLPAVVRRSIGSGKHAKPAVTEFLATVTVGPHRDPNGPYVMLCCADPGARWFDHVAKYGSFRSAFFECLDGDRKLLRTVVSSFLDWMTEPEIPNKETANQSSLVKYGCFLHAASLLTKMYRYRSARTMFPVKVSRTTRIHAVSLSNYCLGFLSANRDVVPATLARILCQLVATVARFHPEVVDSVGGNLSKFGVRILAQAVEHPEVLEAVAQRREVVDELFKKRHRKDGEMMDCLIEIAAALSGRHQEIWQLVTRRMSFLEAAVARGSLQTPGDGGSNGYRSLMANVRCSPMATLTYDLGDDDIRYFEDADWLDPQRILCFSVACSTDRGQERLIRLDEFGSLDRHVKRLLDQVETSLDMDDRKSSIDSIVDVAYSYCASTKGLRTLLDDSDSFDVTGRKRLTELYYLSYEDFDSHPISRDVLVVLWLRLIEAATHTFSSRVYADLKLKYHDTLSKLSAENRTENGIVFVGETTEFLTKLLRPPSPLSNSSRAKSDSETGKSDLMEFLTTANNLGTTAWSQRVLTMVIRSDHISAAELTDVMVSLAGRRSDGQPEPDTVTRFDGRKSNLTDFDVAGLRLATRHGSIVGAASEDSPAALERLYRGGGGGGVETRGPSSELFDCTICTLFAASGQGSENKCIEVCSTLLKLKETTRFFWPAAFDEDTDTRAAFGHLVEELLQQEQPEVYNAFKMCGVSWWLLCSGWAYDCFWNRLSWPEIRRWLCMAVLSTVDYQAFFFVCIAAAQKRRWLEAFSKGHFRRTVYQGDFSDFCLVDHADYLEDLTKKYQRTISKRLAAEFDTD